MVVPRTFPFVECATCASRPGEPRELCSPCLRNRDTIGKLGAVYERAVELVYARCSCPTAAHTEAREQCAVNRAMSALGGAVVAITTERRSL